MLEKAAMLLEKTYVVLNEILENMDCTCHSDETVDRNEESVTES